MLTRTIKPNTMRYLLFGLLAFLHVYSSCLATLLLAPCVRMQRSPEPGRNRNGCNEMETEPSIPSASCCCSSHMTTSSPTILSAISRHKSPAVNLTHATCLVYNTPFIIFFFISASEKGSVLKHPLDFAVTSQDFSKEVGRSLHSVH